MTNAIKALVSLNGKCPDEKIWVEPIFEFPPVFFRVYRGWFKVMNIPWLSYGLNLDDYVLCSRIPGLSDIVQVESVVKRSGLSTIRILFHPGVDEEARSGLLKRLEQIGSLAGSFGCGTERACPLLASVACAADLRAPVTTALKALHAEGMLSFEFGDEQIEGAFQGCSTFSDDVWKVIAESFSAD